MHRAKPAKCLATLALLPDLRRLEQASPAELEQWVERVLDARMIEEVFQPLA